MTCSSIYRSILLLTLATLSTNGQQQSTRSQEEQEACQQLCGAGGVNQNDIYGLSSMSQGMYQNFSSSGDDIGDDEATASDESLDGRSPLNPLGIAYTNYGRLQGGQAISRNGIGFKLFRGIPYAQPPVGNLRFEPPIPLQYGWGGIRNAQKFGARCMQLVITTNVVIGDEDCLFLNVYTRRPYNALEKGLGLIKKKNLRPVIVFIHGGLFMLGDSNSFRARYIMDEDVVLVTLNYRVASFGFLNTGDGLVEGNMGLKDQTMALQWIKENIIYFNGDPKRVTIMGESAGAVCVHLHTLSPMSRGLFSAAISMSGTALSPWGLINEPAAQAKGFAKGLGCPTNNPNQMVKCLKTLPAKQISKFHVGFIKAIAEEKHSFFGPTVESSNGGSTFLPASPLEMLKAGFVSPTPWLAGVNSGEGLVNLIAPFRSEKLRQRVNDNWEKVVPITLYFDQLSNKEAIASTVRNHYLDGKPLSEDNLKGAVRMFSDRSFFLDIHDAAILHSRVAPTYVYYYTYQGIFSTGNLLFTKTPIPLPEDFNYMAGAAFDWISTLLGVKRTSDYGICHGDEMPLLFNIPFLRVEVTHLDADYQFSRKLVQLFVSFAEKGIPDTARAGESVEWRSVKDTNPDLKDVPLQYLNIDKQFSMIEEPFKDGIQFWKKQLSS